KPINWKDPRSLERLTCRCLAKTGQQRTTKKDNVNEYPSKERIRRFKGLSYSKEGTISSSHSGRFLVSRVEPDRAQLPGEISDPPARMDQATISLIARVDKDLHSCQESRKKL